MPAISSSSDVLIDVVQRRRGKTAAADRDRDADMHRRRRFERVVAVEAVERGIAFAPASATALSTSAPISRRLSGGRLALVSVSHCSLARHVNIMRQIIMRDVALRARHGGGDRHAHGVEIETGRTLLFRNGRRQPARPRRRARHRHR